MIGEKIRKIRILKNYSQEYMSDRLKISQTAYSDVETNKTKISLERINDIATIFEMKPEEITSFDEKQIFNNTFNENAKGFFNIKKLFNESFDNERKSYLDQIDTLKQQVNYFKNKLDEKVNEKSSSPVNVFSAGKTITVSNILSSTKIELFDMKGALVKSVTTENDMTINVETAGLYIAKVSSVEGQKSVKVAIN